MRLTLIRGVIGLPADGAGGRGGLALSFVLLLVPSSVRWDGNRARGGLLVLGGMGGGFVLELGEFSTDRGAAGEVMDDKGRRGVCREARRRNA